MLQNALWIKSPVQIDSDGRRGDRISISHAEVLDREGNFYTDNLRTAKEQNTYILSGEGTEVFKPTFSWQGLRYMRVDEYPGEIRFEFEIPEDTAAQITLPNGYTETVGAGKYNYGISL